MMPFDIPYMTYHLTSVAMFTLCVNISKASHAKLKKCENGGQGQEGGNQNLCYSAGNICYKSWIFFQHFNFLTTLVYAEVEHTHT